MFDSANSKHLFDSNPNKKPKSSINSKVFKSFKKVRSIFKEAVKVCHENIKHSVLSCFVGVVSSITVILDYMYMKN